MFKVIYELETLDLKSSYVKKVRKQIFLHFLPRAIVSCMYYYQLEHNYTVICCRLSPSVSLYIHTYVIRTHTDTHKHIFYVGYFAGECVCQILA